MNVQWIIATGNRHKLEELGALLPASMPPLGLKELPGHPVPEESAATFEGNAEIKARSLAEWVAAARPELVSRTGCLVLADDSGLEVDALGGAPGVHSARFAAEEVGASGNAPDAANNSKLLRLLEAVPVAARTARFRCVIVVVEVRLTGSRPDHRVFSGACEGRIALRGSGVGGFGYDPLFIPEGYEVSFAELGESVKNRISHRARAMEQLLAWLGRA